MNRLAQLVFAVLLLLVTWLGTVAFWELQPPLQLLDHPSSWQQTLLLGGTLQVSGLLFFGLSLWWSLRRSPFPAVCAIWAVAGLLGAVGPGHCSWWLPESLEATLVHWLLAIGLSGALSGYLLVSLASAVLGALLWGLGIFGAPEALWTLSPLFSLLMNRLLRPGAENARRTAIFVGLGFAWAALFLCSGSVWELGWLLDWELLGRLVPTLMVTFWAWWLSKSPSQSQSPLDHQLEIELEPKSLPATAAIDGIRIFLVCQWLLWLSNWPNQSILGAAWGLILAYIATSWLNQPQHSSSDRWSWSGLSRLLLLGSALWLLKPAEEYFNRFVLLGSQKAGCSLLELASVPKPERWFEMLGATRLPGWDAARIQGVLGLTQWLREQPKEVRPLWISPQRSFRARDFDWFVQLAGGRTVAGRSQGEQCLSARALMRAGSSEGLPYRYYLVDGPHRTPTELQTVRQLDAATVYQNPAPSAAMELAAGQVERAQTTLQASAGGWLEWPLSLKRSKVAAVRKFDASSSSALGDSQFCAGTAIPVPMTPGRYHVVSGPSFEEVLAQPVDLGQQLKVRVEVAPDYPSRSLVAIVANWSWTGSAQRDFRAGAGVQFRCRNPHQREWTFSPVCPLAWDTSVKKEFSSVLRLSTPEAEGVFESQLWLLEQDVASKLLWSGQLRSWRRLPAVGF